MEKLHETVPVAGSIAGNPLDDVQTFYDLALLRIHIESCFQGPAMGMVIVDRMIARKAFHLIPFPSDYTLSTIQQVKQRANRKPVVFVVDSGG